MPFSLKINANATKPLVHMDEIRHELFVLAMLDVQHDPHGRGHVVGGDGVRVRRAMNLGGMGTILYTVDDGTATVEVFDVIWTG